MKSLNELFVNLLQDVHFAEKQLTTALPKMAAKAGDPKLRTAIESHLVETKNQISRLEKVFAMIDEDPEGEECEAIEGLLEEAEEVMDEAENDEVRDAGMIAAAQAVEHYEIARYGTLRAWASQLGLHDVEKLLGETLEEEKAADAKLSEIANSNVNKKAA